MFGWSSWGRKNILGKSIAKATNRKFIRISLGESEMKRKSEVIEEHIGSPEK